MEKTWDIFSDIFNGVTSVVYWPVYWPPIAEESLTWSLQVFDWGDTFK